MSCRNESNDKATTRVSGLFYIVKKKNASVSYWDDFATIQRIHDSSNQHLQDIIDTWPHLRFLMPTPGEQFPNVVCETTFEYFGSGGTWWSFALLHSDENLWCAADVSEWGVAREDLDFGKVSTVQFGVGSFITSKAVIENANISDLVVIMPGPQHSSGANHLYESETPLLCVNGMPVMSSMT